MKRKHVNEPEFDKIKQLQTAGVPDKYIKEMMKRSLWVLRVIKQSETFLDYKKNGELVRHKAQPEPQGGADISTLLATIEDWHTETNSLLNDMKKRLDFIEGNMVIHEKGFLKR